MAKRKLKMTKRTLATILAASLMMSSVNMSALAAENTETVENTGAEETTSAPTLTVTITEVKNTETGDTTQTTVTEKTWGEEENGADEAPETETPPAGEGTEPETPPAETPQEIIPPATGTTEKTEVEVTGKETTTDVVVKDDQNRVTEESGQTVGNETTGETTTTTDTTVQKDVLVDESNGGGTTTDSVAGPEKRQEGTWDEGTAEEGTLVEGQWKEGTAEEGTLVEGQWKDNGSVPETTITGDAEVTDPLENRDVALELTPGGKDSETIDADINDVESNAATGFDAEIIEQLSKLPHGEAIKETSGNAETVYTPVYGEDGTTLVGYEKSTTTTGGGIVINPSEDAPVENETDTVTTESTPEGYVAGTVNSEGENGEKITTVTEPIYNKDKTAIIGYTITKTTTSNSGGTANNASTAPTTAVPEEPQVTIILPEKPAESTKVDETTGEITKVTVTDVVEDGKVVGYLTTTVKTDANGKELSSVKETLRGTVKTVSKTTYTDPTTETVTTSIDTVITEVTTVYGTTETRTVEVVSDRTADITTTETEKLQKYQLVETAEGLHFYYTGEMGTVVDKGSVAEQKLTMVPDGTLYNGSSWQTATDDIQGAGDGSNNYSWYMRYTDAELANMRNQMKNGDYVLVGYGLYSEYNIRDDQDKDHAATQYAVMGKDGTIYYGYCVELNAPLSWGTSGTYNEKDITDLRGDSLYFATGKSAVDHISSVTSNGFWGSSTGLGSLEAVKDLLTRNGKKDVADSITAGQALAATQAAIWKYGTHANGGTVNDLKAVIEYYYQNDKDATIILDKKAVDEDGNVKTVEKNGETKEVYDTDISFTLAVSTSSINSDLLVQVIQDGIVIETRRLVGDDSLTNYGKIVPVNGVYTIQDIELAEGVTITLNLEGTQHLTEGVYIYECSNSQNFVGMTKRTQNVDLEVNMKFEVEEPEAEMDYSESSSSRKKVDKRYDTKTDIRTDERDVETSQTNTTTVTTTTTNTRIYADVTVSEVTTEYTEKNREWKSGYKRIYTYDPEEDTSDDDTSGGGNNDDDDVNYDLVVLGASWEIPDGTLEILDEDVPLGNMVLAVLPATGDMSVIWMFLSLLSGLGLAGMSIAEKRRKNDE